MTHFLFRPTRLSARVFRTLTVVFALTMACAATASAATIDPSCSANVLSQPFLSAGDSNWYALPGGETPGNFDGAGWILSGGASIQTTQLADGTTGSVLNLPSGSKAVSPIMCVNSAYPTARTEVRDVVGSEGVMTAVAYEGTNTWGNPQTTGQVHGNQTNWTLSNPFNVHPSNIPGAQYVQFTFTAGGLHSDFQIYNFYVDPRCAI